MKRIVYAPKVNAFVKTDAGVLDLSPYLVKGSITRRLDQVSSASIEFRNPREIFTPDSGPLIHPMDPIVIFMNRLKNRPVQVFTGYVDSAPYFSIKAGGDLTLDASCTLKRLLYTYYDPGLLFFHRFLQAQGWTTVEGLGALPPDSGQTVDEAQADDQTAGGNGATKKGEGFPEPLPDGLNDASFGQMLFNTLVYIGNWDPSTIHIENLPNNIIDLVEGIFYQIDEVSKEERKEMRRVLKYILEHNTFEGTGLSQTTSAGGDPIARGSGALSQPEVAMLWVLCGGPEDTADLASAVSKAENGTGEYDRYNGICCWGIWQFNVDAGTLDKPCAIDPPCATRKTIEMTDGGRGSWSPWEAYTNGAYRQYLGGSEGYQTTRASVLAKFPELANRNA